MSDPLIYSARRAIGGFMACSPEDIGGGRRRCWWSSSLLPARVSHAAWDGGDCTARALDAWMFLRAMTGDWTTGVDTEEGQYKLLLSLLEQGKELPRFLDGTTHQPTNAVHIWDVERTLRFFTNRWIRHGDLDAYRRADKAIASMQELGVEEETGGQSALWFVSDQYSEGRPVAGLEKADLWVVRSGQVLEPVARLALATGDKKLLDLAFHLCRGALCGREVRRDVPDGRPLLEADGSFIGHYHSVTSTLVGMVVLAHCLHGVGRTGEAIPIIQDVQRAYEWMFDQARNVNGASRYGWFPENTGDLTRTRVVSETCITADMIELATELACCADMDASLSQLETLWEDAERFTRNSLLRAQWLATAENIELLLSLHPASYDKQRIHDIAEMMDGSWRDVFYPSDFVTDSAESKKIMGIGGCCAYSGPRGLFAAWNHIMMETAKAISFNLHFSRHTESAEIDVSRESDQQCLRIKNHTSNKVFRVFRPSWLPGQTEKLRVNGKIVSPSPVVEGSWWSFGNLREGDLVSIQYPLARQTTEEILPPPLGHAYVNPAERIAYTVEWLGNEVTAIKPEGRYFPFA